MSFFSARKALLAGMLLFVAGCADNEPQTFAPLDYSYLPKIHLNVGDLKIQDAIKPDSVPGNIAGESPVPPVDALHLMAEQRLLPSGSDGTAIFSIDRASILHHAGGELAGDMNVHIDILSPTGQKLGIAEAHVSREFTPGSGAGNSDSPANLYKLTKLMMQDMNVELEFQIRKNLSDWLADAGGAAATDAIKSQSLSSSNDNTKPSPVADAPDAIFPAGTETTPAQQDPSSKLKTGFLKLPSSTGSSL